MTPFSRSTSDNAVRFPVACAAATAQGFGRGVARLVYDEADPFAVALDIPVINGRVITWVFFRDSLHDGRFGRVAFPAGDVVIEPELGAGEIRIELSSPDGQAWLWLPVDRVNEFLAATYERVPAGTESDRIDWDRELPALIGTGGGAP